MRVSFYYYHRQAIRVRGALYCQHAVRKEWGFPISDKGSCWRKPPKDSGINQQVLEDYDEKHTKGLFGIMGSTPRGEGGSHCIWICP